MIDVIDKRRADATYASLAALMNIERDSGDESVRQHIRDNTLVRRIDCFDPDRVYWQRTARLNPASGEQLTFILHRRDIPDEIPAGWVVKRREDGSVEVTADSADVLLPDRRGSRVTSAGQCPQGLRTRQALPFPQPPARLAAHRVRRFGTPSNP